MIDDTTSQYQNLSPTLTPIYIHGKELAILQKKVGRMAEYITLSSRPKQKTFLENCVLKDTEGWVMVADKNNPTPAYQPSAESKLSTSSNHVALPANNSVNSRSSEMVLPKSRGSIGTISNQDPPSYQTHSELLTTTDHTPPVYHPPSDAKLSVTNTVRNPSKPVMILERIASDFDARFSKSELMAKAQKATSEFLDAMAPESPTGVDSAFNQFQKSMNEIFARIEKFKMSSLSAGVVSDISKTICKMAAQKFSGAGLKVRAARILKIRQALELANEPNAEIIASLAGQACKLLTEQTLKILQKAFFENLKNRTQKNTNNLLAAAEPESKITIADASKVFMKKMTAIYNHKNHLEGHELYNDFVNNIEKASNDASSAIYHADVEKGNLADWKAKSRKLAGENSAPVDKAYPNDISKPQHILAKQLRWMKEEDFSNQVKASIKEVFPQRYEVIVTRNAKDQQTIVEQTKLKIESLKKILLEIRIGKGEQEIAQYIQEKRKDLMPLLMANDYRELTNGIGPNSIRIAVNEYLKSNENNLDVAICGLILEYLRDMLQRGLLEEI